MASFRILNQAPQYLLPDGSVNAGGKLYFFESDLTTPRNTWSDEAMTVLNSNPVVMDSAGRTTTDVWGDGEYGVVMADADDVTIWTRNNVQAAGGTGTTIPALLTGQFLTNDGSTLQWSEIIQVPDPTGSSGEYLTTDGSNVFWAAITPPSVPTITIGATSIQINTILDQWGTGSAPASGFRQTAQTVNFPIAFTGNPHVTVTATTITSCSGGQIAVPAVTSISPTQFTVQFDSDDFGQSNAEFTGAVTFNWRAVGVKS